MNGSKKIEVASPLQQMTIDSPTNNMPLNFLEILPLELRRQVYQYVLASPTRCITLSRTFYHQRPVRYRIFTCDPRGSEEIRISFLRCCKQIHDEAEDIFWVQNALDIEAVMQENSRDGDSVHRLHRSIKHQVRAVVMDINFLHRTTTQLPNGGDGLVLQRTFQELEDWAQEGELRSITLNARDKFGYDPRILRHLSLKWILDLRRVGEPLDWPHDPNPNVGRMLYHDYLDVLRGAGGKGGYLAWLERRMILDTGTPAFEDPSGYPIRSINVSAGNPNDMLQELNDAWGGQLVVNGKLSHQDGKSFGQVFVTHPDAPDGEDAFYYTEDIDAWLAAKQYAKDNPDLKLSNNEVLTKMLGCRHFWTEVKFHYREHCEESLNAGVLKGLVPA